MSASGADACEVYREEQGAIYEEWFRSGASLSHYAQSTGPGGPPEEEWLDQHTDRGLTGSRKGLNRTGQFFTRVVFLTYLAPLSVCSVMNVPPPVIGIKIDTCELEPIASACQFSSGR